MAWTNPKTNFAAGEILTAAQMNAIGDNLVAAGPIFTNEAARDAAITAPFEGQRAYLTAPTVPAATGTTTAVPTGVTTVYNGSVWVCMTSIGASSATSGTTTTSASYVTTLTGDATAISVTLVTGTTALVSIFANMSNAGTGFLSFLSCGVTGAGTVAAADSFSASMNHTANFRTPGSFTRVLSGLTAGTNTFTLSYRVQSGGNAGTYDGRGLAVRGIA
jgi:hypothetical protein